MLTSLLLTSFPLFVLAHNVRPLHYGRQANSVPPPPPPPSSFASLISPTPTATNPALSPSVNGSASISPSISLPPTVSVSYYSTNPTAVPLSLIVADALATSTTASIPLFTTFPPGSIPSGIPNAAPLPDISTLNPANYPPLDKTPPTDSAEVQAWIQEVQNSGITIPNYSPTNDSAACSANPDAVAETSRCWWTCQPCVRDTDINDCPTKGVWGITSDDGPGPQTPGFLQYLNQMNIKNTFFLIGSRTIERPQIAQTELMLGHAIGDHTWSHPPLTTLTNDEIVAELGWTRKLLKDVLGVTPNTMRPPYGDIDDRVRAIAMGLGLRPVIWSRLSPTFTFDTNDWRIPGGSESSSEAALTFEYILGNSSNLDTGFVSLQHDLWWQTVDMAQGYFIPEALAWEPTPMKIQNVPQCLGLQPGDFYVETNNNQTNPPPVNASAVVTTTAGSAGATSAKSADSSLVFSLDNKRALVVSVLAVAFFSAVTGAGLIL